MGLGNADTNTRQLDMVSIVGMPVVAPTTDYRRRRRIQKEKYQVLLPQTYLQLKRSSKNSADYFHVFNRQKDGTS